jgi:hypothetical protein
MSRVVVVCAALLLCVAQPSAAALPPKGTLVPGRSLGGVRLGETARLVRSDLGSSYGVCRGCSVTTWYFTYLRFDRRGLAVEFIGGLVSAVYTLWQPGGWKAPRELTLGAAQGQVTTLAGPLIPVTCTGYDALVRDDTLARTVYYIVNGSLWGFGLFSAHANPCR